MTMLSFRVAEDEAAEAQEWADRLGVDRSELLRDALHRHLVTLRSQREGDHYDRLPVTGSELSLGEVAEWGPAEDWADWADSASDEAG
ncbi:MAG: ribbon-helix-helix protein, CopG family [Solirubrobacterales bacterium]|nr:ribbon-helix-helix protein, CopG family [Solirubrobacterales bacterium]